MRTRSTKSVLSTHTFLFNAVGTSSKKARFMKKIPHKFENSIENIIFNYNL